MSSNEALGGPIVPQAAVAVDWSGARADGPRRTWLAEVGRRGLVELSNRWTADSLLDRLVARARRQPKLVLGLDFAFGFPAWFVRERFGGFPIAAWEAGDSLLAEPVFWGRPGRRRPELGWDRPHLRETEASLAAGRPKSIFQVGGAGSVGTGSLRGMPLLARLRAAGFSVWPFDSPRLPLVVEIYPRALTGPVVKSDPAARRRYLEELDWPPGLDQRRLAAASEDAFDAAVSARAMWRRRGDFAALAEPSALHRVEGCIWLPR